MRNGIIVDVTAADRRRLEAVVRDRNAPQTRESCVGIGPLGEKIVGRIEQPQAARSTAEDREAREKSAQAEAMATALGHTEERQRRGSMSSLDPMREMATC
jgi:hypothetical protein